MSRRIVINGREINMNGASFIDSNSEWSVAVGDDGSVDVDRLDLQAENEKLREYVTKLETANLDVTAKLADYIGQYDPTDALVAEAKAENEKLWELVRELSAFADYACDLLPSCNRCPMLGDGMPCNLEKAFNRMRELGVEV